MTSRGTPETRDPRQPFSAEERARHRWADAIELLRLGTAGNLADTDADGLTDADELAAGADPRVADTDAQAVIDGTTGWPADLDGDGDPDLIAGGGPDAYWMEGYGTCASRDEDADGLTNGEELLVFACDPLDPDTDGGGTDDGIEVLVTGTDPRDPSDD